MVHGQVYSGKLPQDFPGKILQVGASVFMSSWADPIAEIMLSFPVANKRKPL
jgi:hypothetical protein